jgi:3-hydroxyacyl-CoA dehydrogenase
MRRSTFLSSGLFAAAGTLGGSVAQASAAETVQVWGLDPRSASAAAWAAA